MKPREFNVNQLSNDQISVLIGAAIAPVEDTSSDVLEDWLTEGRTDLAHILINDLKLKVVDHRNGPLSFHRLLELSDDDVTKFGEDTFVEILLSPTPNEDCVEALIRYGRLLSGSQFPITTRVTGQMIMSMGNLALAKLNDSPMDQQDMKNTLAIINLISAHERGDSAQHD